MNDVKHYVSHSSFLQNSCFHHPRKPSVCIQNKLNMVYIVLMVITTVKSVDKRQDLLEGISTIISCCFWIAQLNSRPFIETDFFFLRVFDMQKRNHFQGWNEKRSVVSNWKRWWRYNVNQMKLSSVLNFISQKTKKMQMFIWDGFKIRKGKGKAVLEN